MQDHRNNWSNNGNPKRENRILPCKNVEESPKKVNPFVCDFNDWSTGGKVRTECTSANNNEEDLLENYSELGNPSIVI